ncbi:hypothetical protein N864_11580 [Intrasporangium chromatireducens Q5-1]|uniref:YCII-related domain-containing protein n=1 Tax=Intrasporangium chromatireducens Q5-1 TaxID=584657 RepID=W9GVW5_9MICO|nr:hypothetical protein [Intrasporangium chromatireducens]EWT07989.1 hypothetical protein N864_11580 [Intrasporangium chromatireducens Q5-1]
MTQKGGHMFAVFVVVEGAGEGSGNALLNDVIIPRARQAGARSGVWIFRGEGVGTSVVTFDDEASAKGLAGRLTVGQPVVPDQAGSPVVRSVEVCPVVGSF